MKFRVYIAFFLPILLGIANYSVAQRYNFTNYSVEEGLAQNQVLCTFQDNSGYMWFGTNQGGVSVFDGVQFKTINTTQGLPNNAVFSIAQDNQNRMLFATNGGFGVYYDNKFTNYTTKNGLAHDRIFKVFCDSKGGIWLGTNTGVFTLENDSLKSFAPDKIISQVGVFNIYEDSKGNIWFCTIQNGVGKYDGNGITWYNKNDGVLHNFVKTIVETDDGDYWIGSAMGFNILDKAGDITERRARETETLLTVNCSSKDPNGALWFGTEFGLLKYQNNEFTRITETNGLVSNSAFSMCIDSENNVWTGTNGKGVAKFNYNGELFTNYNKEQGLNDDIVSSIYEDFDGTFWIGSEGGMVHKMGDEFKAYTRSQEDMTLGEASYAKEIIQTDDGTIWVASEKKGVNYLLPGSSDFEAYDEQHGLKTKLCYSLEEDTEGNIWVGSEKGVDIIDTSLNITSFDDIKEVPVYSILQDTQDNFWFATESGAVLYDGNSTKYFGEKEGLIDGRVRNVVEDKNGNFWFATSLGLFLYKDSEFTNIDESSGLISNTIYSVLVNRAGDLWIGTQKGIQRIDLTTYYKSGEIKSVAYGKNEGFIGVECNSNALYEDKSGMIWVGTVEGVTVFNPEHESKNLKAPKTHINGLRLEFERYDWSQHADSMSAQTNMPINLVLPYKKNHLSFDFVGICTTSPEKVRYQFMLSPLDEDWLHSTAKNEAVYPHIPPGTYTFKVKAVNNDGIWNSEPTEFTFEILPPWYQTWWFYTLSVVLFFTSVYVFFAYRTKQLRDQKRLLENQVEERTKELREEKEKVELINEEVLQKNEIIEEKNKEITDSINYAKGIQEAILPTAAKIKKYLPQSFVLFRPKDIVSGDFYWMDHKDGLSFFTAADCTGHGVPGAFVSMVGANGLNRAVNGFSLKKPSDILDTLTDLVEETFRKRKDGMDVGLCALDDKNMLQYAGANNPLWLIRKSETPLMVDGEEIASNIGEEVKLFEVKANKQPVGSFEDRKPFTNHEIQLEEGDSVYIFSDGYPDQFGGPKGKKFMSKSMKKLLIRINHETMEAQKEILNNEIESWMDIGGVEQVDDICIFGVRV